jgi:hypothetical protein
MKDEKPETLTGTQQVVGWSIGGTSYETGMIMGAARKLLYCNVL